MSTDSTAAGEDLIAELERAREELERAQQRVDDLGETQLIVLQEAYETFTRLLDNYEDEAVGDGDFQTFIEFQSRIESLVAQLPPDLLLRETFEECDERLQKRRLKAKDMAYVREQLEPIGDMVARLDRREEARDRHEAVRRRIRNRIRELDEQIEYLEQLERMDDADLDAPIDRLRDPIEAYNDRVSEAFTEFKRTAPAREVFAFLDRMDAYPLVEFADPPGKLGAFLRDHPAGQESIPRLLEYAGYSQSKLDHYVDDPGAFKHAVGGKQTYLERLDADPLTVAWPPPPAGTLRMRCDELTAAVNRFAPSVVERLRTVAALPRETDYDRLRYSALATVELTAEERERLRSGAVRTELAEARRERDRLETALESG